MNNLENQNKSNNLIIINLGKFSDEDIFDSKLEEDFYNKYMEYLINKNFRNITKNICVYNYHNKHYDILNNNYYKLETNNLIKEDDTKLIRICTKTPIKEIEFESKKEYNIEKSNVTIFIINNSISIYFNDFYKSITIYLTFNAYIKDNVKLLMELEESLNLGN